METDETPDTILDVVIAMHKQNLRSICNECGTVEKTGFERYTAKSRIEFYCQTLRELAIPESEIIETMNGELNDEQKQRLARIGGYNTES